MISGENETAPYQGFSSTVISAGMPPSDSDACQVWQDSVEAEQWHGGGGGGGWDCDMDEYLKMMMDFGNGDSSDSGNTIADMFQ